MVLQGTEPPQPLCLRLTVLVVFKIYLIFFKSEGNMSFMSGKNLEPIMNFQDSLVV